jgi:transcription elongation factor GreA-like protein
MEYLQFKSEYIETLKAFLSCKPSDNYPGLIYGKKSSELSRKLADMEESNPDWVEKIEDMLADNYLLQN